MIWFVPLLEQFFMEVKDAFTDGKRFPALGLHLHF